MRILYPLDYLPTIHEAQSAIIDKFIEGLESAFNVKRIEMSLAEQWKKDLPGGAEHTSIAEYLELVSGPHISYTLSLMMKRLEGTHITGTLI